MPSNPKIMLLLEVPTCESEGHPIQTLWGAAWPTGSARKQDVAITVGAKDASIGEEYMYNRSHSHHSQ